MKRALSLFLCLVVAFALSGCIGGKSKPPTTGQSGQLVVKIPIPERLRLSQQADRQILSAVSVAKLTVTVQKSGSASQYKEVSAAGESAEVAFPSLEVGTYTITVQARDADNYVIYEGSDTATVAVNATTTASVALTIKNSTLEVFVTIPSGMGITSGTVTLDNLQGADPTQELTIAGSTGTATFTDLAPGIWPINVSLKDSGGNKVAEGTGTIDVVPGRTNSAAVTITVQGDLSISLTWNLPPDAPTGVAVTLNKGVQVSWSAVPGAAGYSVYRATSESGSKKLVSSLVPGTNFNDASVVGGNTYWFWVVAHDSAGLKSDFGGPASLAVHANQNPSVSLASSVSQGAIPLTVTYTATASDPDADSLLYNWDLGGTVRNDGFSVETRTYSYPGTYRTTITVADGLGGTASASKDVVVRGLVLNTPGWAYDVAVSGTKLAVAVGTQGLKLYDITNPASPALLGTVTAGQSNQFESVVASGNFAYGLEHWSGYSDAWIRAYDISAATPVLKGSYSLSSPGYLAVSGNSVFFTRTTNSTYLTALNASTPTSISLAGTLNVGAAICSIHADGNYVYVGTSNDIKIVDATNPAAMTIVGSMASTGGSVNGTSRSGNYLCAAESSKFEVFDITDPYSPASAGSAPLSDGREVLAMGQFAFVADGSSFKVVDISDPASPAVVSTSVRNILSEMDASGKYVFGAGGSNVNGWDVIYVGP